MIGGKYSNSLAYSLLAEKNMFTEKIITTQKKAEKESRGQQRKKKTAAHTPKENPAFQSRVGLENFHAKKSF